MPVVEKKKAGRPAKATVTFEAEPVNTVTPAPEDCVSKAQFNALQESYKLKCQEYDRLLQAYRNLALRYTEAGKTAKQFVQTAYAGINLLFPEDHKGEN